MTSKHLAWFLATLLVCSGAFGQEKAAPMTDQERIDFLIRQNQWLMEEVTRLTALASRPRSKEEAFIQCMQAAKGQTSAMAAESIGSHCDQLLRVKTSDVAESR